MALLGTVYKMGILLLPFVYSLSPDISSLNIYFKCMRAVSVYLWVEDKEKHMYLVISSVM